MNYTLTAQKTEYKIAQEPEALLAEACSLSIYDTSPSGRYIYGGSPDSTVFCYGTQQGTTSLFLSETGTEKYVIYAVSDGGEIFVAQDEVGTFIYNMAREKLHETETPESDWSDVRPICVIPGTKHLVSHMMNPTYAQGNMTIPIYGTRSEGGSWAIKRFPVSEEDYLDNRLSYTQAFFCSDDGRKILGRQNTHDRADRPLSWQFDGQGQYQRSTPCDSFLHSPEALLSSPQPEWGSYVITDYEMDPGTCAQQEARYNKAYATQGEAYNRAVKRAVPDLTWQIMSPASSYWMISVQGMVGEGSDMVTITYPGSLGVAGDSVNRPNIKEAYGLGGVGHTNDGGWICYPDGNLDPSDCNIYVPYSDDGKVAMLEYLKQITGTDLSLTFTYSYTPYGKAEQESVADMGAVALSAGGKTLASYAMDMTGAKYYRSTYLRMDKHFLTQPLAVTPVETECSNLSVLWQGDALHLPEPATGALYLYDTTGRLLESYGLLDSSRLFLTELTQRLCAG